jgi:hypothetical protein
MNDGVLILIERMKTNPEDFAPPGFSAKNLYVMNSDSWRNLAEYAASNDVFTAEEQAAVAAALKEATRLVFTAKVLEVMTAPPLKHEYSHEQYATKIQMGGAITANSVTLTDMYREEMNLAVAQTKAALAERSMK